MTITAFIIRTILQTTDCFGMCCVDALYERIQIINLDSFMSFNASKALLNFLDPIGKQLGRVIVHGNLISHHFFSQMLKRLGDRTNGLNRSHAGTAF